MARTTPIRGWTYPDFEENPYDATFEAMLDDIEGDVGTIETATAAKLPLAGHDDRRHPPVVGGADPTTGGDLQRNVNALRYHYGTGVSSVMLNLWVLSAGSNTAANTTEQTLSTYSLPANVLRSTSQEMTWNATITTNTDAMTRTFKMWLGTAAIVNINQASAPWYVMANAIIRSLGSNQQYSIISVAAGGVSGVFSVYSTQTETSPIEMKITAQQSVATANATTLMHSHINLIG